MKTIVVDASVAIKWFVPEIHALAATCLLQTNFKLLAPELIFAEIGNILWKKCRLQELNIETALEIFNDFKNLPINSYEHGALLEAAWQIATEFQSTFYDSLYVALAQTEGCLLVTADRKFYNIFNNKTSSHLLVWIEDAQNFN